MARPRQVTDEEILRHAREVFLEVGPHAPTQAVADRCGLSQAALFKRFGTKRDLLVKALLPPEHMPFLGRLDAGPSDGPLAPQLQAIAIEILLFFREQVPCMATLQASGVDHLTLMKELDVPPPLRLQRAMAGYLERAGDRLRPDLDRSDLATALLGTLHVRAFFHFIGGSRLAEDPAPYVRTVLDTFLHGAGAPS
jgi:AcrR family transcriptional regulator